MKGCLLGALVTSWTLVQVKSFAPFRPTVFIHSLLNTTDAHDPSIRPYLDHGKTDVVSTQVKILNIDSVSEAKMDFCVDMVVTMRWQDRRFRFHKITDLSRIEMHENNIRKIWTPEIYFVNEKISRRNDKKNDVTRLFVSQDGTMLFSKRCSLRLSCEMDLFWYPHDVQTCDVRISTFTQSVSEVKFEWNASLPLQLPERMLLPQFHVNRSWPENCRETAITGEEFTCLLVRFELVRRSGFYTLQIYIPSVMIVTVSWLSFWLSMDATPARVSLGVLTLLTMTTQTSSARAALPRISYVTAVDVWMITCLAFTFLTLLEYAAVNFIMRCGWQLFHQKALKNPKRKSTLVVKPFIYWLEPLKDDNEVERHSKSKADQVRQGRELACYIDQVARIAFPIVFLFLSTVYCFIVKVKP